MPYPKIIVRGSALLLGIWLLAAPALAGDEVLTDEVVIENRTPRPMAGSGIFHIMVRVGGVTMSGEKRDYYITYLGELQPLPEIGATCDITYRNQSVDGWVDEPLPKPTPAIVRYVRRFSCVDPDMIYGEQEFLARAHEASRRRR